MAEAAVPERQLKRSLTALDLTCLRHRRDHRFGNFCPDRHGAAESASTTAASQLTTPVLKLHSSWISHAPIVLGRPGAGPAVVFSFSSRRLRADSRRFC